MALLDVGEWLSQSNNSDSEAQAGLFVSGDTAAAVPLRSRHVQATLHCDLAFADTTEEFTYLADTDCTVVFKFPVPARAAIYRFEATVGDRRIKTETKRKSEAQAEYNAATQQGHTAVLAKQAEGSIYSVELGNLEAHTEAVIRLSYLRQLDRAAGAIEFAHTATWVPPYLNQRDLASPEKVAEGNPKFAGKVAYTLTYDVAVRSSVPPKSIVSPSHDDLLTSAMETDDTVPHVTLSKEVSDPSLDFTLLVELPAEAAAASSSLAVQRCRRGDATKTVAQATFVPRLEGGGDSGAQAQQKLQEVWLVIDGSGSMGGNPEVQARDAASFFVKDLPVDAGIKFNIVMFGSQHKMMWRSAKDATADTAKEAESWIQLWVNANHGGTEIHGALQAVYNVPLTKGATRSIIFMTDGGVSSYEEANIKALVKGSGGSGGAAARVLKNLMPGGAQKQAPKSEAPAVFVLGIGHGIHRGFLDELASLSGAAAQYVVDGEDVAVKTGFLKKCALDANALRSPRLVSKNCLLATAPAVLPPRLFPGEPIVVMAQVLKHEPGAKIGLRATKADGSELAIDLPLDAVEVTEGDAFAVLHAMCSVGALLDGRSALSLKPDGSTVEPPPSADAIRDEVVRIAIEENLVTPHTSSVGVLLQSNPLDASSVVRHEVPLQAPAGRKLWQQQQQYGSNIHLMGCAMPCFAATAPAYGAPAAMPLCAKSAAPQSRAASIFGAPASGFLSAFGSGGGGSMSAAAPPPPAPAGVDSMPVKRHRPCFVPQTARRAKQSGGRAALRNFPTGSSDGSTIGSEHSDGFGAPGGLPSQDAAAETTAAPQGPEPSVDAREVLRKLNLLRVEDGSWKDSDELLTLLLTWRQDTDMLALRRGKPETASADDWATVLVLATLRARLRDEAAIWSDWESRATAALQSRWPSDAGGVGVAIIKAMKLV